ncbi:hypothetical protein I3760_13G098600 [Carya illinoinensis]|nr:hypothetical protein I3760_13G098600 [Carya illinoinensis]
MAWLTRLFKLSFFSKNIIFILLGVGAGSRRERNARSVITDLNNQSVTASLSVPTSNISWSLRGIQRDYNFTKATLIRRR